MTVMLDPVARELNNLNQPKTSHPDENWKHNQIQLKEGDIAAERS